MWAAFPDSVLQRILLGVAAEPLDVASVLALESRASASSSALWPRAAASQLGAVEAAVACAEAQSGEAASSVALRARALLRSVALGRLACVPAPEGVRWGGAARSGLAVAVVGPVLLALFGGAGEHSADPAVLDIRRGRWLEVRESPRDAPGHRIWATLTSGLRSDSEALLVAGQLPGRSPLGDIWRARLLLGLAPHIRAGQSSSVFYMQRRRRGGQEAGVKKRLGFVWRPS